MTCLLAAIYSEKKEYSLSFHWSNKSLLLLQKTEKIFGISLQHAKDHISLVRVDSLYQESDLHDCKDEVNRIMSDIVERNPTDPQALHVFIYRINI